MSDSSDSESSSREGQGNYGRSAAPFAYQPRTFARFQQLEGKKRAIITSTTPDSNLRQRGDIPTRYRNARRKALIDGEREKEWERERERKLDEHGKPKSFALYRRHGRGRSGNEHIEFDYHAPEGSLPFPEPVAEEIHSGLRGSNHGGSRAIPGSFLMTGARWLGSNFEDWNLGANVTRQTLPSIENSFEWHHRCQDSVSFSEFVALCQEASKQASGGKDRVKQILLQTQKHEKVRQHGRDMESMFLTHVEQNEDGEQMRDQSSVSFFSFPFFSLQEPGSVAANSTSSHSVHHLRRPLLESFTGMVNEKRESAQAVTALGTAPKRHLLHVSACWGMIMGEDTLVTCSHLSIKQFEGAGMNVNSAPFKLPPSQALRIGCRVVCRVLGKDRLLRLD